MNKHLSPDRPTMRAHKRQFTWQILAPMILVGLAGLAASGFVIADAISVQSQTRVWADVSAIWLIAPALFFALAFLAILLFVIYGMAKLLQAIPPFMNQVQGFFTRLSTGTHKFADATTKPIFWFRQAGAALRSIFRH
jgi:hypothetical protein